MGEFMCGEKFTRGTPKEITDAFGGPKAYDDAIHLLPHELYKAA